MDATVVVCATGRWAVALVEALEWQPSAAQKVIDRMKLLGWSNARQEAFMQRAVEEVRPLIDDDRGRAIFAAGQLVRQSEFNAEPSLEATCRHMVRVYDEWMDDDDSMYPDWLPTMIDTIREQLRG